MEPGRNEGYVKRKSDGYMGELNIDYVTFDIACTFWTRPNMIWLIRKKAKIYDDIKKEFKDYIPRPFWECKAMKTKNGDNIDYRGNFMFYGFKYELNAWFEDKKQTLLKFSINRTKDQPYIERRREIYQQNSINQ